MKKRIICLGILLVVMVGVSGCISQLSREEIVEKCESSCEMTEYNISGMVEGSTWNGYNCWCMHPNKTPPSIQVW